nr:MAG TPA: hypothetical protein [Caudoviricetes sp.]
MIVERSPVRSFAADCPFLQNKNTSVRRQVLQISYLFIFQTFTHVSISLLCCSINSFRIFQQFEEIHHYRFQ